jgi:hypothetical protein
MAIKIKNIVVHNIGGERHTVDESKALLFKNSITRQFISYNQHFVILTSMVFVITVGKCSVNLLKVSNTDIV